MPVRADVAGRFNGVEKPLTSFLIRLMDIVVLTLAWVAFGLRR
jgi:hypothetical protein